jgi:hypothetical protein
MSRRGVRQNMAMDFPSTVLTSGSIHDPSREVEEHPDNTIRMLISKNVIVVLIGVGF